MAKQASIHCCVITPEEKVLEADATAVVFPAHDGEVGILRDRAPMLSELGIGVLRLDTVDQGRKQIAIDGGFAQVLNNDVTILTDRAADAQNITRADAEKALKEAEAMPLAGKGAADARQKAIRRAKAQLRIARD